MCSELGPRFRTRDLLYRDVWTYAVLLGDHLRFAFIPSVGISRRDEIVEPTRSLGQERKACDEFHLSLLDQNVGISGHAYQRMRALGISSEMVAQTLNAPDRVQRLPLSTMLSYFYEFEGRTIRVMTTLDDWVIAVSWTANRADINND